MKILLTFFVLFFSSSVVAIPTWKYDYTLGINHYISLGYEIINISKREVNINEYTNFYLYYTLINKEIPSTVICTISFEGNSVDPQITSCYEEVP